MRTLFPALVLCGILALTAAHSQPIHEQLTFEDGYRKTWAEMSGPTFAMTLSDGEVNVIRRAFDKLKDEHEANPAGVDDYLMGRRQRILEELDRGGFGLFVGGPGGWEDRQEKTFPLTLPEMTLIGFAVSRDRYRVAPEPEQPALVARIWDWFMSTAIAQPEGIESIHNREAIALFDKIAAMRHVTPGGAI